MERRPGNSRFKVGGEERKKRGRGGERMGSGSSRYLDGMGLDWIVRRKYVLVPELVRAVNRCSSTHGVPLPRAAGLTVVEYSYCRWRMKYPSCTSTGTGTDQRLSGQSSRFPNCPSTAQHSTGEMDEQAHKPNQTRHNTTRTKSTGGATALVHALDLNLNLPALLKAATARRLRC